MIAKTKKGDFYMNKLESCYKNCIGTKFLLPQIVIEQAKIIVSQFEAKSRVGRPKIELERGLNGIFYILKTGIQWNALPHCFGSNSAIHRLFQWLTQKGFFEQLWHRELMEYDKKQGLRLATQAADCSHIKAPLGKEKTGKSPVDRRKLGTKRSIIVEENGLVVGCALGPGNRHDSQLFEASIRTIPTFLRQPQYKEMHLDSAYDSTKIQVMLFNYYYVPRINKNNRRANKPIKLIRNERKRWIVESTHSWMNRFRRLLIRFEKRANNYLAFMQLSFAIMTFNKLRI